MANRFADRMYFTINGFEALHLTSADIRRVQNLTRSDTMTRNRRSAGFKSGNMHIQISCEMDIEEKKAQIDPALADRDAEINLVAECGGERYIATGLAESEMSIKASVGNASKSFSFEALDLVNENGTSVNFDISLG